MASGGSRTCTADSFTHVLDSMLVDVADAIDEGVVPVVRDASEVGRDEVRRLAEATFKGNRYWKTFAYRIIGEPPMVIGEIGSSSLPGLVHLLEKGHATIGGNRVKAYPHVDPAGEKAFERFESGINGLLARVGIE